MKWLVCTLLLLQAAWLLFDGARALTVGDYLTPASGPHTGQLGPWARMVRAVGVDPRSTAVKVLHVAVGGLGLAAAVAWGSDAPAGKAIALIAAVAALWYVPFGTLLSLAILGLIAWQYWRG